MKCAVLGALALLSSGCFASSMRARSGGLDYEASGFLGPAPVEAASADLMSAQADMVRAQARTMEAHPELLFVGRGYGYWGYGGYGRVDPSYYYPYLAGQPARSGGLTELDRRAEELEERAQRLEERTTGLESRATTLEDGFMMHLDSSSGSGGGR